jgi:membrane protease YdiL (CAAX protease family)
MGDDVKRLPAYFTRSWILLLVAWVVAAATHGYLTGAPQIARSFGNALFIWLVPLVIVAVARLFRGLKSDRSSLTTFWIIGIVVLAMNVIGELSHP